MSNNSLSVIILAAGKGSRMKSDLPKVMHKVAGCEMINHVINNAKILKPKNINIIASSEIMQYCNDIKQDHSDINLNFIIQHEKLGTGHALKIALQNITQQDLGQKIIILYADTPLVSSQTIDNLIAKLDNHQICVAAFEDNSPNMYGRLIIDDNNFLQKIIEFKDADEDQRKINICNSGIIAILAQNIAQLVSKIDNNNASKEYYLTQLIEIANKNNYRCSYQIIDRDEVVGVNDKIELANVEKIAQKIISHKLMKQGVTIINPESSFFAYDIKIGKNCVIYPNNYIGNDVEIADNVIINSFCHLVGVKIGSNSNIGPFARIRPETLIEDNCKIGNFVEIKKSQIAKNVKIGHLSYIGDSEINQNSNIGAGVVTCNFNGKKKFKTKIGKNSFIGSNSSLIAPIEIGHDVMVGAGSVINKNINDKNTAIARSKQVNLNKNYFNNDKKS